MINLDALKSLRPALTAGSNEKADPLEFLRMVTPMFVQAAEGVAFGGASRGGVLAPYVGQDYADIAPKLQEQGINLKKEEVETNWPVEVWVLSQAMLPLLSFTTDVVAYTSGGKILGFGANPISYAARLVATEQRKARG